MFLEKQPVLHALKKLQKNLKKVLTNGSVYNIIHFAGK